MSKRAEAKAKKAEQLRQKRFVARQREIDSKLSQHPLGFVPVVWQSHDGNIWVEEQHQGNRPIAVCSVASIDGDRRANVGDLFAVIDNAVLDVEIFEAAEKKRKVAP